MSEYPEHEKLTAVADRSQSIGEFIEWLGWHKKIVLAEWTTPTYSCAGPLFETCVKGTLDDRPGYPKNRTCPQCGGEGTRTLSERLTPIQSVSPHLVLLAEFFDIDLEKIESEKRQMLDEVRANAAADDRDAQAFQTDGGL